MRIARSRRPTPDLDRSARWLTAILCAVLALASIGGPVAAADPAPSPSASTDPVAVGAADPGPASPGPSVSPDPSPATPAPSGPSPEPSTSPAPSAAPDPSPSFSPSPDPTPSPQPSPSPSPADPWPTTVTALGASVQFYGRGYGHGVGLNQYGARGRALAGQTADQILAAYFEGTRLSTTDPLRTVRVLLMAGFRSVSSAPLRIYGRGGPWTIAGIAATFPADAQLRLWRTTRTVDGSATTTWHLRVLAADGTVLRSSTVSGKVVVRPASAATSLQLFSKPSSYDTYRGRLKVVLKPSTANVVNHVPLDDYVRGVLPAEMPASWPREALAAQAVAARSYAVRRLHPGTGSFDLYDDTRSQVYRGLEVERSKTSAIIDRAPGAILVKGSRVVNAFYHSTGGGATEDNEFAFVGSSGKVTSAPVSYLRGIDDRAPDGTPYDAAAPYYAWTTNAISLAQLSSIMATDSRTSVGDLARIDLTHRGVSGRLYRVTLYGSAGTKTVSADVFCAVYNAARPSGTRPLRSNLFNTAPLS
jgi:SpoIID/LytB domain protein